MAEIEKLDSLTRMQKVKICSNLLHRIRIIQGQTSPNFAEPHFTESKEYLRQTKNIIHNIKEGLKTNCSDNTSTAKLLVPTNSAETPKTTKKRPGKPTKTNIEKSEEKEEVKHQAKSKKSSVQDTMICYECDNTAEQKNNVKLSQIFSKKEQNQQKESYGVREAIMASPVVKINKKKKKRKRKREDIEDTSSITINHSDTSIKNEGDTRCRSRKLKTRPSPRRTPQCAGDESDIEDEISSRIGDKYESSLPKKKLRNKNFTRHNPKEIKDINDIVNSTIEKLNTVNENVQKVIEDSLSSGSSHRLLSAKTELQKTINNFTPPQGTTKIYIERKTSVSSLNWSTVSVCKSAEDVRKVTPIIDDKFSINSKVTVKKKNQEAPVNKAAEQSPSSGMLVQTSTGLVDVTTKLKKKKHKVVEEKLKEVEKAIEKEILEKKKKKSAEPVSSMKKTAGNKKTKKQEHVNFVATPEIVPACIGDATPINLKKKTPNLVTDSDLTRKKTSNPSSLDKKSPPPSAKPALKDTVKAHIMEAKRQSVETKRRANSARISRAARRKEVTRVKSASHINSKQNDEVPQEKRGREEAPAAEKRPRSRSSSRKRGNTPKSGNSRDLREIYEAVRTNTTHAIANINEQMSATLKDSIAHLNEICSKVRTTLSDMEKDEQTYKKLKSKNSYDMSSEAGSICSCKDTSLLSLQSNASNFNASSAQQQTPIQKPQLYTLVSEPSEVRSIEKLMESMTMMGDTVKVQMQQSEEKVNEDPVKKKSRSKKRRSATKPPKPVSAPTSTSKTKCVANSTSNIKNSNFTIPIWQKKPPSVIEEIQLTVKKQATRSQYRGFLQTLKYIAAKKQRSQTQVLPNDFKNIMEKHQDKVYNSLSKHHKSLPKKATEAKPLVEVASAKKICNQCTQEKCTCGVTVENTTSFANHQRMQWMQTRSDAARRCIQSFDILDEITLKDLEPIQSEYPRKDHVNDTDSNKRVEDSLLYKLLFHEDPKILESLLRISDPVSSEQTHLSRVSLSSSQEKARSASDAYKLYEEFELNLHQNPSINLVPNKASTCISTAVADNPNFKPTTFVKENKSPVAKEKQKALHTCPKEFNDDVIIPADLKSTPKTPRTPTKRTTKRKLYQIKPDLELKSLRSKKRIEDKMKVIGKTSSIRSIGKYTRRGKFSKENIKTKVKMKKVLTVMNVMVPRRRRRHLTIGKSVEMSRMKITKNVIKKTRRKTDLSISERNKEKITNMSKRDVVRILKPYIFFDLQPPVVTVMPVFMKYNHQNKNQKPDHSMQIARPTTKKIVGYLKDHDDDCKTGKKLCKRCQMLMQSGDESCRKNEGRKTEPLSTRQLWKNKYRPTTAENLVTKVLGKNASRKRFEVVPPNERFDDKIMTVTVTPRELNKNATNTRSKLDEIKSIVRDNQPILGQHLDEIIDSMEFKIIDVLSNPKNQSSGAFLEIENEIQSIMDTISDLKVINTGHIQEHAKFKSNTDTNLQDFSESNNMKSITDGSIRAATNTDANNGYVQEEKAVCGTEETENDQKITTDDSEEKLDKTYSNLGKDIEKVINGLDTIMAFDGDKISEEKDTPDVVTEKKDTPNVVIEQKDDCEQAIITFCEQVDEVMKNLGNVDEFNLSTDNLDEFASDVPAKKSDEYLTPFMRAVKNYRQCDQTQSFVDFLDKLSILSNENFCLHFYPSAPVYKATVQQKAQILEVVKTYNQAVQYEETPNKKIEPEETFYETEESQTHQECHDKDVQTRQEDVKDDETYVLATNHWMQTEPIIEEVEVEVDEVMDQVMQTSSTEDQFNEVEEYVQSIQPILLTTPTIYENTAPTPPPVFEPTPPVTPTVSEKDTQIPNDIGHSCFTVSVTKDVQVTEDLSQMNSTTVASQATEAEVQKTSQCQMTSDLDLKISVESIGIFTEDLEEKKETVEESTSAIGSIDLEKFTNRMESCVYHDASDISIDDYPRSICTDSCIPREISSEDTDLHLRDKTKSYPETKTKQDNSEIISLYENRKTCSDTIDMKEFLEDGFPQGQVDSYDSMLATYASSDSSTAISTVVLVGNQVKEENVIALNKENLIASNEKNIICLNESEANNIIRIKLSHVENVDVNNLHKHVLHSVYGIVFALMFLSINLNYSC